MGNPLENVLEFSIYAIRLKEICSGKIIRLLKGHKNIGALGMFSFVAHSALLGTAVSIGDFHRSLQIT